MPSPKYKIVIIGAGNVATNLVVALQKTQHKIVQLYSRKPLNGGLLLSFEYETGWTCMPEHLVTNADIYIIAVNDDSISNVTKLLKSKINKKAIVIHTSGTVDINALKEVSNNYGVFYPIQTLSKRKLIPFKNIPICIEANNTHTLKALETLAKSLSGNVQKINSEQRKIIHLAAVIANNFSNYFYLIAEGLLAKNNLSFDLLKPLIKETANKIKHTSPSLTQTGPAIRGDKKTIDAHLKMLDEYKDIKQIYKLITDSIIKSSKHNKP